jgi:IS1 family transposase
MTTTVESWTTDQAKTIKNAFTDAEYAEYTALAASGRNIERQNEILRDVLKRVTL